ncbi:hypothetical protein [Pseudomonas phage phiZ98]|nr:hypothetical protein [Pseudomonas phage phiZ98]
MPKLTKRARMLISGLVLVVAGAAFNVPALMVQGVQQVVSSESEAEAP